MKTDDFNYELDESLIAQSPLDRRDSSRLMILDRYTGDIKHSKFNHIIDELKSGDVLVMNDTKVIPARLYGVKEETNAAIELLLLKEISKDTYECLTRPAKRVKVGTIIKFSDKLSAKCIEVKEEGIRLFKLIYEGILIEILEELGEMPLPPYIHKQLEDKDRYQTVYAKNLGSAAAPTAGLHFTQELINAIKKKGVRIVFITLHVGLGTFRPVSVDDVTKHKMHSEFYIMDSNTADILNESKEKGRRIISVGTTTTRTLETIYKLYGCFKPCQGYTDIFIYPGFKFQAIDGLITNFHLPKSTLLMLVSAFASKDIIMNAYKCAVDERYRFFSFGDSMFIR